MRNRTRAPEEAARLLLAQAPVVGTDLVLIGREATRRREFTLLIDDLRRALAKAGVPIVPGETPASQEEDDILRAMTRVGFPVLLKATSGGGGRGMRIVRQQSEAAEAIGVARREAQRAFADGTLYVERLIERPRHVEVQIFADQHGHVVHVLERDCTLQRRHQKVIEETPAPALAPAVRDRLTAAAVAAARRRLRERGTVEFLVEGEGDAATFYFLEVNTRLRSSIRSRGDHGVRSVRAQLLVASGEPLPLRRRTCARAACDRMPHLRGDSLRCCRSRDGCCGIASRAGRGFASTRACAKARA